MALKLTEFTEQFIVDFSVNLAQIQKTGSKGKLFIPLANLETFSKIEDHFL